MSSITRKWTFTAGLVDDAPDHPGVYALWDNERLLRLDFTEARGDSIRARLRAQLTRSEERGTRAPTHYSWEIARKPRTRAGELVEKLAHAA